MFYFNYSIFVFCLSSKIIALNIYHIFSNRQVHKTHIVSFIFFLVVNKFKEYVAAESRPIK